MNTKVQVSIVLDPEKDADLIDYLKDAPKTWIMKRALRKYKEFEETPYGTQAELNAHSEGDDLGF